MARLGKPKGSRNKKTLKKLAAAVSRSPVQSGQTDADSSDPYSALNDDRQHHFSHAGSTGNLLAADAHALAGQLDADFLSVSTCSFPVIWA